MYDFVVYVYAVYSAVLLCIDLKSCVQYMHSYGMNFSDIINYMYCTCNVYYVSTVYVIMCKCTFMCEIQ